MKAQNIVDKDIAEIVQSLGRAGFQFKGKTVLITGGSGFLGTYIVDTLLYLNEHFLQKNPCHIVSVDNYITSSRPHGTPYAHNRHITLVQHNVINKLSFPGKIDYIIHAAGIASPVYYQKYPLETIDVAVYGTRNMLELARQKKVSSFLFFSSSEIYGNPTPDAIPTKETYNGNVSCIGERSCYDESKRIGETLCMNYYALYRTPVKIVRPFNIFGPGMRPNDYRVIPSFIYNALHGKPVRVHSSGNQTRTFCYITNAVTGFLQVLLSKKNGEVYNVGNDDEEIDMNHLAKVLASLFQDPLTITNVKYPNKYPKGEPQRRRPDLTKIKKELGYNPKVDLVEGLQRTIDWCRTHWT